MSKSKPSKDTRYSNTLTDEQKKHYKRCLVNSQDGMWYLFPTSALSVAIINPRVVYPDFDTFQKETLEDRLVTLFETAFCRVATKAELKDPFELAVMVWMQLCKTAVDRLNSAPDPASISPITGKVKRVFKKLENRGYEVIKLEVDPALKLPPQAKTCLEFFAEMVKVRNPEGENRIETIPEKDVQEYVLKEQARLKTRQDPWRIFQYYRPQLIKDGFIRLV